MGEVSRPGVGSRDIKGYLWALAVLQDLLVRVLGGEVARASPVQVLRQSIGRENRGQWLGANITFMRN